MATFFMLDFTPSIRIQRILGQTSQFNSRLRQGRHRWDEVRDFIGQLLSLPFLPNEHIGPAFEELGSLVTDQPAMVELCSYLRTTWLENSTWSPRDWSVFMRSIRTNNDVEGWHRRLIGRAGCHTVQFYNVIKLLYTESSYENVQLRLVKEARLCRNQQRMYRQVQGKIFKLWDDYQARRLTTSGLLAACNYLTGPAL
ncbi:uncharacterized protein LOC119727826 [Patiria miniata]|uniref:Uncharacterized protein n=1 Tax=Patiria miniata TaxID=46514 RepID=A0A913ZVY9_PATMI|nr:uncharacterized protein LOC119727826 [Patiria miniata]